LCIFKKIQFMKKILTLLSVFIFLIYNAGAQVFWTENFEGGSTGGMLASAYTGPNGTWAISVLGSEGGFRNEWYVSCAENGHTTGVCGTPCAPVTTTATLSTLHVGSTILSDMGASYYAGGSATTDRRAESPTINCTGRYSITVAFYYIEDGDLTTDNATLWYYNGTTWSLLDDPAKTAPICPGGQGMWTHYTYALPTSANNNANVKLAFRWVNNADGVGTDPSFAVDSMTLSGTTISTTTSSFTTSSTTACQDSCITFTATSTGPVDSFTWSMAGITISTPHASPVTQCFSVAGVYTMTLTAYHSGTPSTSTHSVTINPAPAAITGSHTLCVGTTSSLSSSPTGGTWSSSSTATATVGTSGVVTGVAAGVATITYSLATGCKVTFTVTVYPLPCTLGLPRSGNSNDVTIFPNPAADELTISMEQGAFTSYTITNGVGQVFMSRQLDAATANVNIKALPRGLYYITLRGNDGTIVRKFVKL
jgi:hypothetical protein